VATNSIDKFIRLLKKSPRGAVFNPWWQVDKQNDIGRTAPAIRRRHLRTYLQKRIGKAKVAVVGEALGYRGGHFSGIPMTSERILLGKQPDVVAAFYERRNLRGSVGHGGHRPPLQILCSIKPRRTSKPAKCEHGFSEPTATIVWSTMLKLRLDPEQFVIWNAFPWHSFDPRRGLLSNRMPNESERSAGLPVLKAFLKLFSCDQVVALGKIAAAQLEKLGVHARYVRHPASGGAKVFRQQIGRIIARVD
jgi:uracil-DNA glycosylase